MNIIFQILICNRFYTRCPSWNNPPYLSWLEIGTLSGWSDVRFNVLPRDAHLNPVTLRWERHQLQQVSSLHHSHPSKLWLDLTNYSFLDGLVLEMWCLSLCEQVCFFFLLCISSKVIWAVEALFWAISPWTPTCPSVIVGLRWQQSWQWVGSSSAFQWVCRPHHLIVESR